MSQGPLYPNLSQKVQKEVSQMANRKLSYAMLYRWFKCKLKPPKKHMENCSKCKCVICKKTFFSDRTFQKHKRNCPPKRYPCPICKKDYSRKSDTDKHMKTHAPVRNTFTCHWCRCQCLTGKQLDLHIEQKHGNLI